MLPAKRQTTSRLSGPVPVNSGLDSLLMYILASLIFLGSSLQSTWMFSQSILCFWNVPQQRKDWVRQWTCVVLGVPWLCCWSSLDTLLSTGRRGFGRPHQCCPWFQFLSLGASMSWRCRNSRTNSWVAIYIKRESSLLLTGTGAVKPQVYISYYVLRCCKNALHYVT